MRGGARTYPLYLKARVPNAPYNGTVRARISQIRLYFKAGPQLPSTHIFSARKSLNDRILEILQTCKRVKRGPHRIPVVRSVIVTTACNRQRICIPRVIVVAGAQPLVLSYSPNYIKRDFFTHSFIAFKQICTSFSEARAAPLTNC